MLKEEKKFDPKSLRVSLEGLDSRTLLGSTPEAPIVH